jgi:hypothetical protein
MDEVHKRYVATYLNSDVRSRQFAQLEDHAVHLGSFVRIRRWWIGGSFVTSSNNPGDVDCVPIIDGIDYDGLESDMIAEVENLTSGPDPWNSNHKIDCLGIIAEVPDGHPAFETFLLAWGRFDHFLTNELRPSRPPGPKGYLEVTL